MSDAPPPDATLASTAGEPPKRGKILGVPMLIGALVLGGAAVILARHYTRPEPQPEAPAPGMTVGSDSVTLTASAPMWSMIKLAPVDAAEPHWTDPVPGRVVFDETRTSRLGSPLQGRVTAVNAERGQKVKQGQPLFSVASSGLAELRAELEKANVELKTAKVNFERTKALVDSGSLPAKELVTVQQEVTEAELAVRLATQKLSSLKIAGGGEATAFTVVAPRDGVVVEKTLNVGQNVDPSTGTVMAIADLGEVWIVADLFENDVGSLAAGAKAKVAINGTEIDATIDQVSSVVDPDRHTVPVRAKLANDGTLRPNAYAQLRFFDPSPGHATIPATAVLSDGANNYVYVKTKDGALKRRNVVVGSTGGGKTPVMSGLDVGEQVVVQGAILLDNQIQLDN